ncbi:AAA family ATPase [Cyathus striatus]|nr:AAA family ATPase [Cyathus striatus]
MSSIRLKQFVVQLNDDSEFNTHRTARRLIFNSEFLKNAKLATGDIIAVAKEDNTNAQLKKFAVGVVWPSLELPANGEFAPIQVSTSIQLTAGLEPGEYVHIFPLSGSASKLPPGIPSLRHVKIAKSIRLKELHVQQDCGTTPSSSQFALRDWLILLLREALGKLYPPLLVDLKYITSSQQLQIQYEGQTRTFAVTSASATTSAALEPESDLAHGLSALAIHSPPQIWTVNWDSTISFVIDEKTDELTHKPEVEILHHSAKKAYSSVGGLNKQIEEIRDLLEIPLTRPELFRHFGLKPPRGILLHGPPGTGKTHLARAIASSTYSSVLVINGPELSSAYHGETESKLRDVFKQAREKSPCIVILDEVDALVPRREDSAGGEVEKRVVATLLTILDGIEGEGEDEGRVVVIGTTNRPNAIDPALRRPGRFDKEIEIGIPDAEARCSILNVLLSKTPHSISPEEVYALASRAHGYVGADLSAVVREAGTISIKQWLSSTQPPDSSSLVLTLADLEAAMPTVRPSAMRSLFVDTPPVRYADVGGQAGTIQKLREAVEWPLLHPEAFKRLGVRPPKGLLLYGPPGCSKTILARACACESGVNFVAVKGPELLNKFVGESERAVREIFRKARAAAPSIIFFDEVDALASSRTSDSDTASSHEGVLTSLLNEMDGVQELLGVTVIAATNRPDTIDPALMRPGRLDRILYVGPPDHEGRIEILKIRTRTMSVDPHVDLEKIANLTDGCSGAEISALCQEAAILTMQQDMSAPYVPEESFVTAAKSMKRQITPAVLSKFAQWRDGSDTRSL